MLLFIVPLAFLWLRSSLAGDVPSVASSEDISQINNLRSDDGPTVSIDPRLRRALLRVLTKLDEEDRHQKTARQMAEVMQNIITEEDFIKYFQEQGLEKELLENFESNESKSENQKNLPNLEEILSYSSDDSRKETETPFTFASYPEYKNEDPASTQDLQNKETYPSTNPTPTLRDAIYFQIPEPIHISESEVKEESDSGSLNLQETRSIQGPTLESPTEDNSHQAERLQIQEEEQSRFNDQSGKEDTEERQKVSFISLEKPKSNEYHDTVDDMDFKTDVDFQASNGTEVQEIEEAVNSSMKIKLEKHEVEFLHAPLLAAFTVQQDQQGLPRRVIPLNYPASGEPIPLPSDKDPQISTKQNSNQEEKQKQLQQQVQFLQEQQLQEQQYQRLQEFVKQRQRLIEEEAQRQLIIDDQKRQYENEQRLVLARQRQQQILFQSQHQDTQLEALKEIERQRYYEQQQNLQKQNFQSHIQNPQNVHFQKSVDFQLQANIQHPQKFLQSSNKFQNYFDNYNAPFQPSVGQNRVNRKEPSNFVGNFGLSTPQPSLNFYSSGRSTVQPFATQSRPSQSTYLQPSNFIQASFQQHRFSQPNQYLASQHPLTVDGQIQSLLSIAGIAGGLRNKPSAQEDLNIVSKVLALGHGEAQYQRQQFQASSKYETIVEPPSRVIESPSRVIEPPKI